MKKKNINVKVSKKVQSKKVTDRAGYFVLTEKDMGPGVIITKPDGTVLDLGKKS